MKSRAALGDLPVVAKSLPCHRSQLRSRAAERGAIHYRLIARRLRRACSRGLAPALAPRNSQRRSARLGLDQLRLVILRAVDLPIDRVGNPALGRSWTQ